MQPYVFQIKNLQYHDLYEALYDVNLDLRYKEVHALIIKNSSEQSIFIKALDSYTSEYGQIIFKGTQLKNSIFKNKKICVLHQKPILVDNISIAENLSLANLPKISFTPFINWKKVKQRCDNIFNELDFHFDYSEKICNLSDESRKIVHIAQVFMNKPDIIIMHEPTEALSINYTSRLYKIIHQYKENGGSIIYITKQWEEVLRVADNISVISKGRVVGNISSDTAKKDPQRLLGILENYKFAETLQEKNSAQKDVLDAVFKAAEFLASEYELTDILLLLAKEVTKVMKAGGCIIDLIDESTSAVIDSIECKTKNDLQVYMKTEAIIKIAKENDIYYSNANDKEFYSLFDKKTDVKTIICIPVLIRSQITGVIQIYYDHFYVYSEGESKYLSAFARHAGIAIEDTRLLGRSALLQESHHRIKNNLQSIVGLVSLQRNFVSKNPEIAIDDILDGIVSRINSIAAVHDVLSKDKLGRSIINVKKIVETIIKFLDIDPRITINLDLDNIFMPYNKATSIALIVNELTINCYKYAFINMDKGIIDIKCKQKDDYILLIVKDNGVGLKDDFNFNNSNSLGFFLVKSIVANEFKGKINLINRGGVCIESILHNQKITNAERREGLI